MPQITIVGRVREEGLSLLRGASGIELSVLDSPAPEDLLEAMPRTTAIIVRTATIDRAMIEAAPLLRVIAKHGVGYDNIDVAAASARGVPVAVAASANAVSVAEHAFWMILELLKHGRAFDQRMRGGSWAFRTSLAPAELAGKALLVIGYGRIGRRVAARAAAFDARVLVHDPLLPEAMIRGHGFEPCSELDAAVAAADIVSLHCPLGEATRGMIDERRLRLMKPGALLVNTARGDLVDEQALASALRNDRLAGAGLDVFASEPPPPEHPLLGFSNVLLTPHMAGVTVEAAVRMAVESAENVLAALADRLDPAVVVNPEHARLA